MITPSAYQRARAVLDRLDDFTHFDFFPDEDQGVELCAIQRDYEWLFTARNILAAQHPEWAGDYSGQLACGLARLAEHLLATVGEAGLDTLESVLEEEDRMHAENAAEFECYCGASGPYHELCDETGLANSCGGTGERQCFCGGDLCVCHHHGAAECDGCEDCDEDRNDE